MKKMIIFLIVLFFICVIPSISAEESFERVVVIFDTDIDYTIIDKYPNEVHHVFDKLNTIAVSLPKEAIEELRKTEGIIVEKDKKVQVANQTYSFSHQLMFKNERNSLGMTGKGVKVGILDTGIITNHPDLDVTGGINVIDESQSFSDDNGHGTHIAGIVAAKDNSKGVLGLSPNVELYAIKALNKDGEGRQTDVSRGVEWAINNKIDILNLSLTTLDSSTLLEKIFNYAYDQGMIIVGASGNTKDVKPQLTNDILYPARYSSVIAVGSVNKDLNHSYFSFTGDSLDFVALGEEVLSTSYDLDFPYEVKSGTSVATPVVSAIFSLYKEAYPELTNQELRKLVQENTLDLGKVGKDNQYGFGLIQPPSSWFLDINLSDESQGWFASPVTILREQEMIKGYPDGSFRPKNSVTRGELAMMVSRALNLKPLENNTFSDVATTYFARTYINRLVEKKVINGYPDYTFRPQNPVTRAEAAKMIRGAFELNGESSKTFKDVLDRKLYYYDDVYALTSSGIIDGYPDGTFKPNAFITRAEIAKILDQILYH